MSKRILWRFASECRRLAYECAEDAAPRLIAREFDDGHGGHCAIGWALKRTDPKHTPWDVFWDIANLTGGARSLTAPQRMQKPDAAVIDANNETPEPDRHLAVVFPLLWLADTLEDVARGAA